MFLVEQRMMNFGVMSTSTRGFEKHTTLASRATKHILCQSMRLHRYALRIYLQCTCGFRGVSDNKILDLVHFCCTDGIREHPVGAGTRVLPVLVHRKQRSHKVGVLLSDPGNGVICGPLRGLPLPHTLHHLVAARRGRKRNFVREPGSLASQTFQNIENNG